jgi:hypothetical protein
VWIELLARRVDDEIVDIADDGRRSDHGFSAWLSISNDQGSC